MIEVSRKSYKDQFKFDNEDVGALESFWAWAYSDLVSNLNRAVLAEYIVAMALGIEKDVRAEWLPYDLDYKDIKIEVKSAGFIQAWEQKEISKPIFNIGAARAWDYEVDKRSDIVKRQSDIYVFCLHHCKEREKVDMLDLSQWTFYLIPTKLLDEKLPTQKSLSLNSLKKYAIKVVNYENLAKSIIALGSAR